MLLNTTIHRLPRLIIRLKPKILSPVPIRRTQPLTWNKIPPEKKVNDGIEGSRDENKINIYIYIYNEMEGTYSSTRCISSIPAGLPAAFTPKAALSDAVGPPNSP